MGVVIGLFFVMFLSVLAIRFWFIVLPIIVWLHFSLIDKPNKNSSEKEPFLIRYKRQATIPLFIGGLIVCVVATSLIPVLESTEHTGWFYFMFIIGTIAIICSANPKAETEPKQEELQDAESPKETNNNDNVEYIAKWQKPFGNWTKEQLSKNGQEDRYNRSVYDDMHIISINKSLGTAEIMGTKGTVYDVTLNSCNCPDFEDRHLPCKHIYLLARNVKKSKGGLK